MSLTFRKLQPVFAAEASPIDLREAHTASALAQIRAGMDQYAVLVFRDQPFSDDEQLAFAQRFDGTLHAKTGAAVLAKNRFGNEALTDISNVDESGELLKSGDRRRMYALGNRLWHTDASSKTLRAAIRCSRRASCRPSPRIPSRRHALGIRCAERRAQSKARRPARAPFDRLLAGDARLRILH
jgi:hypothetical protein